MRNGNDHSNTPVSSHFEFLPYLWGMETREEGSTSQLINSSYRTYEEWKPTYQSASIKSGVRSYRTYEEWKLEMITTSQNIQSPVLTVPMRNGNRQGTKWIRYRLQFLPYLWGMETLKTPKHLKRPISSYRTYEEWKLKRWKRETKVTDGSYRTYEEWKRGHGHFISSVKDSSYRTYEEWKPPAPGRYLRPRKCSYRTYEEWKLWMRMVTTLRQYRVLTVPMRNGNSTEVQKGLAVDESSYRTYEEWKQ